METQKIQQEKTTISFNTDELETLNHALLKASIKAETDNKKNKEKWRTEQIEDFDRLWQKIYSSQKRLNKRIDRIEHDY